MVTYIGQVLGEFVAGSSWASMSALLRHEAKRALLNYFGCALGSAADPVVATAVNVLRPATGANPVSVIGRRERLNPMDAAFTNAVSANLLDYDDTHWTTAIHPTGPAAAPLLALAEQRGASGVEVLQALILGVEVECRIGNAVSPQHYARGMHITATCGVFGAAVACAKLLQLTAPQIWTALGIAASESAGVMENLPTAAKNVAVGNAARNGLLAALLAQAGYTAAPAAIEGPFGWANAIGDTLRPEEITRGLGEQWEVQAVAYKPYPCGFVFHAVIDACIELKEKFRIPSEDVATVVVRGSQLLLDRGTREVVTDRDSRVSIAHTAAIGLVRGKATVDEFTAAAVSDPQLRAMRATVRAELANDMPIGAASVTVVTHQGRSETVLVRHARGSRERPLSDRELEEKFHGCAAAFTTGNAERIRQVWSLDSATDLAPLWRAMAAP